MLRRLIIFLIALIIPIWSGSQPFQGKTIETAGSQVGSAGRRTVWSGVYTAAQTERGKTVYEANCASCHGNILGGNRAEVLIGKEFMQHWREDNLESWFAFIKASMPPVRTRPTDYVPISDAGYVDVLAYILQANEFPQGSQELKLTDLRNIQIEEKDGPKPLATSTLVQVVGCMTMTEEPEGVVWLLNRASQPTRSRNSDVTTPEELKNAEAIALGTQSFRLQNLGYLGRDFNPNVHNGRKMQAKGVLIRHPNGQRLDVTSLKAIDSRCAN